ncbi:alkene reductase [Rugamonas sp.]|uniref:alkene reductase n=1 Tax=Rugamonas sp. TaxID=1926287 RepID=UPI0025EF2035|nr:alkene reductase [Rugamonas sp.]
MSALFTPIKVGPFTMQHRIVMAPLSRLRSDVGGMPTDLAVEYYSQRASEGGLLVTEGVYMAEGGNGYLGVPGISDDGQIAGWKKITAAVHAKGGLIFAQLWHVGRVSHSDHQPDGGAPVAPSAVPYEGVAFTKDGWIPSTPARALETGEIEALIVAYRKATERAVAAGFDGVEVHSANGYLLDQFLQDGSNKRSDAYGGSLENRSRFLLEAVEAAASVIGMDRVGVRISPSGEFGGMADSDPQALFTHVAQQLDKLNLAYLHLIEPRVFGNETNESKDQKIPVAAQLIRKHYKGLIIAAGGFTPESAAQIIEAGDADLVAFGRHFISNPDLPARIRAKAQLAAYNRDTFYGGQEAGYTDYPFLGANAKAA